MSIKRDVWFKIKGQVSNDYNDNDYEIIKAKINLICTEHNLELVEAYSEDFF